jgi:hypothetical protein
LDGLNRPDELEDMREAVVTLSCGSRSRTRTAEQLDRRATGVHRGRQREKNETVDVDSGFGKLTASDVEPCSAANGSARTARMLENLEIASL